jgi:hypothetical protein
VTYVRRVLETDAKDEYFSVQIMEERCVESDFIFHSCPKRGELAKQMLLSIAVDMILELLSNVDASGDMLPIVFTNFTLQNVLYQIMLVESIEKAKNPNASKNPNAVMDELLKMQDMVTNICNTLHYLRRRIKCTCLDDVYKNFRKDNSRSVLCHGCHKWCEKKEVWVCQFKVAQFCSSSCHKKSWPVHKQGCQGLADELAKYRKVIEDSFKL